MRPHLVIPHLVIPHLVIPHLVIPHLVILSHKVYFGLQTQRGFSQAAEPSHQKEETMRDNFRISTG